MQERQRITRFEVLQEIDRLQCCCAEELSEALDVSKTIVWSHLQRLLAAEHIFLAEPGTRGRDVKRSRYSLTPAGIIALQQRIDRALRPPPPVRRPDAPPADLRPLQVQAMSCRLDLELAWHGVAAQQAQ